ncbi:MAG: hypothetical protein ACI9ZF_001276 [Bradyrhizobium sp.]|jgi:hypothetical protein
MAGSECFIGVLPMDGLQGPCLSPVASLFWLVVDFLYFYNRCFPQFVQVFRQLGKYFLLFGNCLPVAVGLRAIIVSPDTGTVLATA